IPNAIIGYEDPFLKSDLSKENRLQYAYLLGRLNDDYQSIKTLVSDHYNEDQTSYFVLHNELVPQMSIIGNVISSISSTLLYMALGFAIFSSLLLINYISISVKEKKHDIGILRALGTRNIDVIKIFLIESLIISTINMVISSFLFTMLTLYVNQSVQASNGLSLILIYPSFRQYILIILISLFVSIISTVLPVKAITSMKPIDAIRSP
ncbi:MAG: FtsX-like permease family protein, partial [Acholeplasma sp.]|nr:FtsX-like permease family protein [Acholeplasma sp.]